MDVPESAQPEHNNTPPAEHEPVSPSASPYQPAPSELISPALVSPAQESPGTLPSEDFSHHLESPEPTAAPRLPPSVAYSSPLQYPYTPPFLLLPRSLWELYEETNGEKPSFEDEDHDHGAPEVLGTVLAEA